MQWVVMLLILLALYSLFRLTSARIKDYIGTYLLAAIAITLTISLVLAPDEAFSSALHGLKVWWEIVFPALLPFFIGSEILMGLGVVNFMGVLLEPLMRPLFNVPGVGSFVMAMGLASGYPIGAILTSKLRRQNMCNRVEAERLISFTNTADPLFMVGAVAVGMFGDARLGIIIVAAHYLSSLMVGLVMRFYKRSEPNSTQAGGQQVNILIRAFHELYDARQRDGRPLGQLLGESVKNAVNTLLMIGGYIILFSVIIRIASVTGIVAFLAKGLAGLLSAIGLSPNLSNAALSGVFEITIGCNVASQTVAPLAQRIIVASAVIAWSGLSVHGQVAGIINGTDIRITPYLCARALHAFLAGYFTWLLWNRLGSTAWNIHIPVFLQTTPGGGATYFVERLAFTGLRVGVILGGLLVLSVAWHTLTKLQIIIWRRR